MIGQVYNNLKDAHPAMRVFKKDDFPEEFHYAKNPRALPIIGIVDVGWLPFTVLLKQTNTPTNKQTNKQNNTLCRWTVFVR